MYDNVVVDVDNDDNDNLIVANEMWMKSTMKTGVICLCCFGVHFGEVIIIPLLL